jgi:hypothetical protein
MSFPDLEIVLRDYPLLRTIWNRQYDLVDTNAVLSEDEKTTIVWVCLRSRSIRLACIFLSRGCLNPDNLVIHHNPLFRAYCLNQHKVVEEYLLTSVNTQDKNQQTVLHYLAQDAQSHASMIHQLYSWGADVNIQDDKGQTPLHLTIHDYNRRCLLWHNANYRIKNRVSVHFFYSYLVVNVY